MESPYQIILEDLLQNSPLRIIAYPPPYSSGASIEEKFRLVNEAIERAKDLDDRILQLVNMFYLGQLLVRKIESRDQRNYYTQRLSAHYRVTAKRIFYIFEAPGVNQLMRTTRTTLTTLRRISKKEYKDLVIKSTQLFNRS